MSADPGASLTAVLDRQGTILSVNGPWRAAAEADGLALADHGVGSNYLQVCDRATGPDSEGAADAAAGIRAVLGGARDTFDLEYPCPSPAGARTFHLCVAGAGAGPSRSALVVHVDVTTAARATERFRAWLREDGAEALRRERFSHLVAELANDFIYVLGPDARLLYVNPKVASALRATPESLVGRRLTDVLPREQGELYTARLAALGREPLYGEEKVRLPGGETWLGTWLVPVVSADGAVEAVMGLSRDITDRRAAEEALKANETRLAKALEATSDGFWDWDLVTDEVYYSPGWLTTLGYDEAELAPTNRAWEALVHPDDRAAADDARERHLAGEVDRYLAEYRLRRKDGRYLWSLAKGMVIARDEEGRPLRMVGTNTDITARRQAEDLNARLSLAVDQSPESIVITDADANIIYVNPAFERLSGYAASEVLGRNPRILKSGLQDAAFYEAMWQTLTLGDVWRGILTNRRKDGSLYVEEASISPVHDASGRLVNYVAVKHDVTRERQLEEQLRGAQRMEAVGRLAGGIAHDFNNILGVIRGYTELMLLEAGEASPLRAGLSEVMKAAERAVTLTRQLLAYSRRQVLNPKALRLNDLVQDAENMIRRLVGEHITLRSKVDPELGWTLVDPGQVDQVLMNLVVNARDAMADGGLLTIETANAVLDEAYAATHPAVTPGAYVALTVTDTGTGIARDDLDKIFEPFFTTKPMGQGTGLGLSTVYGIVKQSGGHIWVYSEPGQGTSFKVYLPRIDQAPQAGRPAFGHVPTARGRETVLVVEDDDSLRRLTIKLLEGFGYGVVAAANAPEAISLVGASGHPIDLLLTDVVMPGGSGRLLAERMLQLRPGLKVLYTSGYTDEAIVHHGVLEPGIRFLAKPFDHSALARAVREALDAA